MHVVILLDIDQIHETISYSYEKFTYDRSFGFQDISATPDRNDFH